MIIYNKMTQLFTLTGMLNKIKQLGQLLCQLLHNTQFSQSDFNLSERLTRRVFRLNDCSYGSFVRLLGRLFHNLGPRYLNECCP